MKRVKIKKRRYFLPYRARSILLSFFLAFLVMLLFSCLPFWKLKQFVVLGFENLAPAAIEETLSEFLGKNIWWLNYPKILEKLKNIPAIKRAVLKRKFFSQMVVEIEEREPYLIIIAKNDSLIADSGGLIIARSEHFLEWQVNPFTLQNLPLLIGLNEKDLKGKSLKPAVLKNVQVIITSFEELIPPAQIKIDFMDLEKIRVLINDNLPIILGNTQEMEAKTKVLKILLPVVWKDFANIEYLDVSVPSCPVVRYL